MNTDNPFEAQRETQPQGTGRDFSQGVIPGRAVSKEKLIEQLIVPEKLSPSFLAACHCSSDASLLEQELEYLWDDGEVPGKFYEVYLGKISRNPVVKSKTSGKFFVLPWSLIIQQAVEKGIDN